MPPGIAKLTFYMSLIAAILVWTALVANLVRHPRFSVLDKAISFWLALGMTWLA